MVFRNFLGNNFFSVRPPPVGNGDLVVFWPVLGHGHLEKFQDWAKNRKTQFPGARGPEIGEKKVITLTGTVVRTLFNFTFCPTGCPGAGTREIQGFQAILAQDGL